MIFLFSSCVQNSSLSINDIYFQLIFDEISVFYQVFDQPYKLT